jgi:hypothetical protein
VGNSQKKGPPVARRAFGLYDVVAPELTRGGAGNAGAEDISASPPLLRGGVLLHETADGAVHAGNVLYQPFRHGHADRGDQFLCRSITSQQLFKGEDLAGECHVRLAVPGNIRETDGLHEVLLVGKMGDHIGVEEFEQLGNLMGSLSLDPGGEQGIELAEKKLVLVIYFRNSH